MVEITVCGYPRSGNCWIARLLGEALNVRVVGWDGGNTSIAAEGEDRPPRNGFVRQAHFWPQGRGDLRADLEQNGHIFLHMVRDPRDIAVSMSYYWDWTLDEALDNMIDGPGPLELPPWVTYVESWFDGHFVPILRYEDFHKDARGSLTTLLDYLELEPQKDLDKVVGHQSFAAKRAEMEHRGNRYPFGRVAQLRHLRKGNVGDWQSEFNDEQNKRALKAWRKTLKKLEYTC